MSKTNRIEKTCDMISFSKILTIVVPSFNMEALLRKGLQSLLIEKNPQRLEVIVVNDGSTDQTLAIAKEFHSRFPQTFTFIDKENGNYGSCINAGLKIAQGKYIKILDADDYVDTSSFEALVDFLETTDADVVVNDYQKLYISGKHEDFVYSFPAMQTLEIADIYNEDSFSSLLMPALTYRTSKLRDMGYHQTEGISYTDLEWCYAPMTQMSTLCYFNQSVYVYVIGREGQTMNPLIYRKRLSNLFQCLHSMMESLDNLSLEPWAERFSCEQLAKHACEIYRYHLIVHPNEPRELLRSFDIALKKKNPKVYAICGSAEYRKRIPYLFVEEWRSGGHENIPIAIRVREVIYNILGTIHYHIMKYFNPNLKR